MNNFNNISLLDEDVIVSTRDSQFTSIADKKNYYIESYGCQMNLSDSEIVAAILQKEGFNATPHVEEADLIFLNTCSIRDKAEQTIYNRLKQFNALKKKKKGLVIGILGCMAERLKSKWLETNSLVDLVAGPDSYRDLPKLITEVYGGQKSIQVLLSREETYADIAPVRYSSNGVSAFVTIMRGCDNMCAFCVVPFTRGRERSRPVKSILNEVREAVEQGYKEVTLLGQNVDSYRYSDDPKLVGKKLIEAKENDQVTNFAQLLAMVAEISPTMRVRFATSHPKDMSDDVLYTMKRYDNICKYIHLPVQSGSSTCLERMNRTYDRSWYLGRIQKIKEIMPECAISSDIIAGFCGETEDEHQETLSLMREVQYDLNYMFYYSERPGTVAAKKYSDDIPEDVKKRRLQEIIDLQLEHSQMRNQQLIGTTQTILIEYTARKNKDKWIGRTDSNKKVLIDQGNYQIGDYVDVEIIDCNNLTLFGRAK